MHEVKKKNKKLMKCSYRSYFIIRFFLIEFSNKNRNNIGMDLETERHSCKEIERERVRNQMINTENHVC